MTFLLLYDGDDETSGVEYVLLESGDRLLLESGDAMLLESSSSTPEVPATLAASLGGLTASIVGVVEHPATLSAPLGGLTAAITAVVEHPATLDAPLGALTGQIVAAVAREATFDAPLGALTATMVMVIVIPAPRMDGPTFTAGPVGILAVAGPSGEGHTSGNVGITTTREPPA